MMLSTIRSICCRKFRNFRHTPKSSVIIKRNLCDSKCHFQSANKNLKIVKGAKKKNSKKDTVKNEIVMGEGGVLKNKEGKELKTDLEIEHLVKPLPTSVNKASVSQPDDISMAKKIRCKSENDDFFNSKDSDISTYYCQEKLVLRNRNEITKWYNTYKTEKDIEESMLSKSINKMYEDRLRYTEATHSFIQVCMDTGFKSVVRNILIRNGLKHNFVQTMPYNAVLSDIYKSGNFEMFEQICDHMKMTTIMYDENTFAIIFQCLGRFHDQENTLALTHYYIDLMHAKKFTLKDILQHGQFVDNKFLHAKQAIARVDERLLDFIVDPPKADRYECKVMQSLNRTLLKEDVESPTLGVMTKEEMLKAYKDQKKMEESGYLYVKTMHNSLQEMTDPSSKELMMKWHDMWKKQYREAFRKHKAILYEEFEKKGFETYSTYPFFVCLEEDDYMNIIDGLLEDMRDFARIFSPGFGTICHGVGEEIFNKYNLKHGWGSTQVEIDKSYEKLFSWYEDHSNGLGYNPTVRWEAALNEENALHFIQQPKRIWPDGLKKRVGEIMMNILMNNITIPVMTNAGMKSKPAFLKVLRIRGEQSIYEIMPCKEINELQYWPDKLRFRIDKVPMLCPPMPWLSYKFGGYILERSAIFRSELSSLQRKQNLIMDYETKHLPILDGLTILGSIPWKLNNEMLDLILKIFNNGGWMDLKIPVDNLRFVASLQSHESLNNGNITLAQKLQGASERCKKKDENFSLWMDCLQKLSLANHFRDKVFWLPQSIDFRGRAYPIPPHMTHVSADTYRSLLLFAKGKRLGPDGLRWLKIHIINLSGLAKREKLCDRLKFCEDNLDNIFDSADKPLDGNRWWIIGDEPWQTLAACKELTKALRSESPEDYISHLPIHQDGSCNGLQHYAALGRDSFGAAAVNVKPSDKPQDVYRSVLDIIMKRIERDISENKQVAAKLKHLIKRKTIKQTVMTSVYGVTLFGAQNQIEKQLREVFQDKGEIRTAVKYLSVATFIALKEMFSSAKEIQNWLTRYARFISLKYEDEVSWYTPLGLPIVQPYMKLSKSLLKARPHVMKQCNSFPPNFIHSLDSTHMFLTSFHCAEQGTTFASIHDCYWTHASDVDKLNIICREQFVNLYSLPLLDDLKKYYDEKYPCTDNSLDLSVPSRGDFDINEVKDSTYFFS